LKGDIREKRRKMAWRIIGTYYAPCSCNVGCPCILGEMQGDFTRLLHGAAAFRDDIIPGQGTCSRFYDPEMREWESGGHAERGDFDWSA
jgi:hypothetical protein